MVDFLLLQMELLAVGFYAIAVIEVPVVRIIAAAAFFCDAEYHSPVRRHFVLRLPLANLPD